MRVQNEFAKLSYAAHEEGYSDYARKGPKADHARAWLDEGSINTLRFNRMYRLAKPLLESYPGVRRLTVGDGRQGMDAMYLQARGAHVLATDISETPSRREMEKVALGLGLRTVAFKGVNDYYLPGVEFEPATAGSKLYRQVSGTIARYDLLCRRGISQPGLLAAIIFQGPAEAATRNILPEGGYHVVDLPENPYLGATISKGI